MDTSSTRMPRGGVVDDTLIDALVAAAGEHQVLLAAPPLRDGLGEQPACGSRDDENGFG